MSVSGRIAIDLEFFDRTSTAGGSSLNTITLRDAVEYTTGKVAIVTGTVGTAVVTVGVAPATYKDASGNAVSFGTITRAVFRANPGALIRQSGGDELIASRRNEVTACSFESTNDDDFEVLPMFSSASYTLVLYGT